MSSTNRAYKRSWKNLLIDRQYQLTFTLFMVCVCAVLMGGLGWMVLDRAETAKTISIQNIKASEAFLEDSPMQFEALEQNHARIRGILVGTGVLLLVGLFVFGIKMTHRVAGPLFKVGTYLDKVKDGRFDTVYPLRRGDQLVDFYVHFKEAHEALRREQALDVATLKAVIAAAERGGLSPEAARRLEELKALLSRKEAGLV